MSATVERRTEIERQFEDAEAQEKSARTEFRSDCGRILVVHHLSSVMTLGWNN